MALKFSTTGTTLVNIAASSPKTPRLARLDFDSIDEVRARTGMKSHGQAQLANDLLTAAAPPRYGITAVGYGPGVVRTQIRREVSPMLRGLMAPFFARSTRSPDDVAAQILSILDADLAEGSVTWFDKRGEGTTARIGDI